MKYYKHPTTGEVYAYEADGSQDEFILPSLVQMTDGEVQAHLNPPGAPSLIPTLTPRQIRFVLTNAGLREQVETHVAQAGWPVKDWWEFSLEYQHDHPILQSVATQLGLTAEQVEQMFREGALL